MDLEERIARLIDPEAWETVDYLRELGVAVGPRHRTSASSLHTARRVIDGLHLEEEHVYSFDGDRITHILGQIPKEDTPAAPHELADITTYADSPNRVHIDTATGEARTEEPE